MSRSAEQARSDLELLLQEPDLDRPLDSLENTVVRAYLTRHRMAVSDDPARLPSTIRGWMTWVDHCSKTS